MVEIKISEDCIKCGAELSNQVTLNTHLSEGYPDVWRPAGHYVKHLEQYPVWHHGGFCGVSGPYLNLSCNECGAEYTLKTGPISLYCEDQDIDDVDEELLDAERKQRTKETSFLSWLKSQRGRGDCVGDFSFDCFYAEDQPRGTKQRSYRDYPSWPKRASSYREWMKFLNKKNAHGSAITAFKIAWSEYNYLRNPDER